jgi:hypothetical protein
MLYDDLVKEIKAMQEFYEKQIKILHERIDILVVEIERLENDLSR